MIFQAAIPLILCDRKGFGVLFARRKVNTGDRICHQLRQENALELASLSVMPLRCQAGSIMTILTKMIKFASFR